MAIILTQTDNAVTFEVGCSGRSAGVTTVGSELVDGGTAGVNAVTIDPDNNTEAAVCAFATTGGLGESTWEAGDYVVRLNISGSNGTNTWTETYICERTAGGAFNTVASLTGQTTDISGPGIVSHTVNRSTDFTPAGTDSDLYIVIVVSNADNHGNSTTDIVPDQNVDTPITTAAQGVSVTAGVGSLSITGHQPSVSAGTSTTAGSDSLTITQLAASIAAGAILTAGAGSLSIQGHAPTVSTGASQGVSVTAGAGSLSLNGQAPQISAGSVSTALSDSLTVSGQQPSASTGVAVTAGADSLSITGHAPSVSTGDSVPVSVTAGVGSISISGQQPTVSSGASVTAGIDSLSITGQQPAVSVGATVTAGVDSLTFTGLQPTVSAGGASNASPWWVSTGSASMRKDYMASDSLSPDFSASRSFTRDF